MSGGFFTSVFLELMISMWYFTLFVFMIKLLLVRFVATDSFIKAFLVWAVGSLSFIGIASLCGFIFSSAGMMIVPVLMLLFAIIGETLLCVMAFNLKTKRIFLPVAVCNTLLFLLLFGQFLPF